MNKPCKHCSSSGAYIDFFRTPQTSATIATVASPYAIVPCKYCQGKGYIDEDEIISVPRKFIKDEYFNNQ
jgi:hypothetical protein